MTNKRWKLTISYDGGPFVGWQRQDGGQLTVQQAVEEAFLGFCGQDIAVHAAGRTDSGVHAQGQVVHADLDYGGRSLTGIDLAKALNAHLRPLPVCVVHAEEVSEAFHARFDAVNKLYTYCIVSRPSPPVLDAGKVWHIHYSMDVEAMQEAAAFLVGHHDFTTFRDSECQAPSPEKTLDRLDIEDRAYDDYGGREVLIHAEGKSFLHHQVRNMAGTLALVGRGKWRPQDVKTALETRDRTKGGATAPAAGLCLIRVDY